MIGLPHLPQMVLGTTCAIGLGATIDAIVGDPPHMPHIVRAIGKLISTTQGRLRRQGRSTPLGDRRKGVVLVIVTLCTVAIGSLMVLWAAYVVSLWLGIAVEAFLCFQCLAATSLRRESMKVRSDLLAHDLPQARKDLSMIVGRDTADLDEQGIIRAGTETVAENACDGVVAPLVAMGIAGGFGGLMYKAINTMDSMVGYRNPTYIDFGRTAARLDDIANWVPARLTALAMVTASVLTRHDARSAWRIWRRDHANHESPNSAHSEAVCAGALGVQLGGPSTYAGIIHDKPLIGDHTRDLRPDDIAAANRLMTVTSWLVLGVVILVRLAIWGVIVVVSR